MKQAARSPPTVILTLRLWHEPLGNDQSEWRGEIKNLSTGEVRYFRRWDEIALLVRKMIGTGTSEFSIVAGRREVGG